MLSLPRIHHYLAVLGTFLLLLEPGMFQSYAVFQLSTQREIQEGQTVTLQCNFTTFDSSPNLFWYRQYVGREPQLVVHAYKVPAENNQFSDGKYSTVLFMENKTVPLTIKDTSFQEEAVYYCALSPNFNSYKVSFGSGTRLTVRADLEDSPPSIYELKPDASAAGEKKDKAACLFTDYFPNPLNVTSKEGEEEKEVNGSVVVVKEEDAEKGTASYGIVLWSDKDDNFHCTASDKKGQKFASIKTETCLAEREDNGAFETDERLNLLSLTVLGLRIVFLKSVAFNLLLTFRLWSR